MGLGDGKAQGEAKEINKELGFILDAVSSLGDQLVGSFQDAIDSASELGDKVDVVGKTMQRGLIADLKQAVKNTESLIDLQSKVTRGVATQKDIAKEAEKIALNRARLDAKRNILGNQLTKRQKTILAQEQQQLDLQQQALDSIIDENDELQKQKSLFQLLKENAGGLADKIDKSGTLSKVLSGGISSVLTPMRLLELAIVGVFDAMVSIDKLNGELAKNLNISVSEAAELSTELSEAANKSGSINITTKGLGEALMAANGELGIFNTTIDDNLILFQELQKTAGLTYQELRGVKSITDATGGDLEKNTKEIMAQARLTGQRLGVALNEKDVLKDISNVSKATTLSLGKNPGQISAAVSATKALGMEMSKVEGIADSLLNFESSIEKELEAELLLGKNINLEKARQAALNNDIAGVAEEIAKQAGSAADFAKMNRIQQEALAGAVGMSREELANSLFVQEQIGNLTGDEYELRKKQIEELEGKGLSQKQIAAELGKQSINDLKNQQSVQENLNNSIAKMKELFVSIAGPLMQIITPIVDLLVPAIEMISYLLIPISETFQGIADVINSIIDPSKSLGETLADMGPVTAGIAVALTAAGTAVLGSLVPGLIRAGIAAAAQLPALLSGAIAAVTTASATTLGIGAIAIAAGIAGVVTAMSSAKSSINADDMMSPGKNTQGYGSRTLFGPEGAIALNNRDTVIAGTDLFPKENKSINPNPEVSKPQQTIVQQPTVVQQDNSESKKTNALLEALINKPAPKVQMDSIEVGTVAGMSAFSIQ